MQSFPDAVTISYKDLGKTSEERLKLVVVLGAILHKPPRFYTPQALGLTPQDWILLHDWATANNDPNLIVAHNQGVTLLRDTNDHVLIGIDLLIADLHAFLLSSTTEFSAARLWTAISRLIDREVALR